ncbi:MAG: hypothetical protein ACO218_04665 [Steroidobacteraceae bacterium]
MANTTFSGPVRSENGFQSISKNATTGAVTVDATYDARPNFRVSVDNTTLNTGAAVTTTLTTAQSGTIFEIDGTDDLVVNMPARSTANFYGALSLLGGAAANPASDVAGDTLTLPNSTVVNSRVKLTCISDDGTNSTWKAEALSSPIATIA